MCNNNNNNTQQRQLKTAWQTTWKTYPVYFFFDLFLIFNLKAEINDSTAKQSIVNHRASYKTSMWKNNTKVTIQYFYTRIPIQKTC